MFKNDCRFVNSAVGPVHAITFPITLGTHGAYKTYKLFSLLCISDIFRLCWAIATVVLKKELEQFYRRLKRKNRLGQDSNPGPRYCTARCFTKPSITLSSHLGDAHFWSRIVPSRSNMKFYLFGISCSFCPIYISYGQLKTNSKSAIHHIFFVRNTSST